MIKQDFMDLAVESNIELESAELERLVRSEEDASLKSPGTPAHYYRFFYYLAKKLKPKLIVELGTYTGISACCFADGNPEGMVITVDHAWRVKKESERGNIKYYKQDSLIVPGELKDKKIDILFSDTFHDGIRCLDEYNLYLPYMADKGIIFFDDIDLFPCMKKFWDSLNPNGEKFELPIHGWAGFGVVILN